MTKNVFGKNKTRTETPLHCTKNVLVVFTLMIFSVFLIGTVSAFEWDNVGRYDEETKTMTIKNSILGIPTTSIAEVQLLSSLDNHVLLGYGEVARFKVSQFSDYENALKELELFDKRKGDEKFTRDYDFKVLTYEEVVVAEYGQDFITGKTRIDGYHNETKEVWTKLTETNFKENDVLIIGIFTNVIYEDKVEWIPNIMGVRVDSWAVWTADLNVGLLHYYNLNDTVDLILTDQQNLSEVGSPTFDAGLIGNNVNGGITNPGNYLSTTKSWGIDGGPMAFSIWVNATSGASTTFDGIIGTQNTSSKVTYSLGYGTAGGGQLKFDRIKNGIAGGIITHSVVLNSLQYRHICASYDGANTFLYLDGVLVASGAFSGNGSVLATTRSFILSNVQTPANDFNGKADEGAIWGRNITEETCVQLNNSGLGITFTDEFPIIVNLTDPADSANFTVTDLNFTADIDNSANSLNDLVNATISIWFSNGTIFTQETNLISGDTNITNFNISMGFGDNFIWNVLVADNNSKTGSSPTNATFNVRLFTENSITFNVSTFETASETFTTNITTTGSAPTDASLVYNGTTFTEATITSFGGNVYDISRTIDIPLVEGNTSFHFDFLIDSNEFSTGDQNQLVNLTTFVFCENGVEPNYINFTFTNETVAEEAITAEIDTTWNFWLGSGTVLDSLTYSNTTENTNYQFCLTSGGNRTLSANVSLTYNNALSQLRNFADLFSLTNVTTTQNLFLLPTADGIFVTFQVVTPAEQVISGVFSEVTKDGNIISSGFTDDAGLITFFLDPDTSYVFSFSKEGFTTVTTTLVPTQTSFTIIMGTIATISQFDTTRGIDYQISPIDLTLKNDTLINFNLTLNSTFHSLDQFGFVLKNSTGTVFNVTISTDGTGGFLSQTLDTGSNTDIIMEVFWTITGNQTNITRIWLVFDLENEGFSILTFFNNLSTYVDSDLFGLDNFGLGIIVFLIIIISTGVVSMKFGITSPPGISIVVFSLVAFFDVALGLIPNPLNAIPNFPTIFVGFIFLGILYSEVIR